MDNPLEEKRALHEQRDRLEMAIVEEMLNNKKGGHKDQLDSQHRQKRLLDKYMDCSRQLLQHYAQQSSPATLHHGDIDLACDQFYQQYDSIVSRPGAALDQEPLVLMDCVGATDYLLGQTKVAVVVANDLRDEQAGRSSTKTTTTTEKLVEFTDEEAYGRYLDLNECHEAYLQVVKNDELKPNYLNFLTKFDKLIKETGRERKLSSIYKAFLERTLEYFQGYSRRARPLFDYKDLENSTHERFLEQWRDRTFPGWFTVAERRQEIPAESMIELEKYESIEQLMGLGLDCLKQDLQVRGLKCGGTLEDRAKRLWSIRGKQPEEIDQSLKSGSTASKKSGKRRQTIEPKYIASIEAKLHAYTEFFNDHWQATIENVQRKQARTAEERNESDDDVSDVEDEECEQNDVIYNPKNLPLGWDGKPIPYWLYKLHGLNLTYTCEICGNATYKGPKTFQRHFAEQRHAHGMKCLGIPNTAHFANITSIQDAITLWDKLKDERQKEQFQPQINEEYEDSQGNVVNKKTYEDLKRQGLL